MEVISVINQKGGTGKTTTVVNLAAALGKKGKKVMVIDGDLQMSATLWLGVSPDEGLYDVLVREVDITDTIVQAESVKNVYVLASTDKMRAVEKSLFGEMGSEFKLKESLEKVSGSKIDFILIDCPPNLGMITANALVASHSLIVPVSAHALSLQGVKQLLDTISKVKKRLNPDLRVGGILATRVDRRTKMSQEVVELLRNRFKDDMFKTVIRENVRLAEAPSYQQPINVYDAKSRGAEDYKKLAKELIQRTKKEKSKEESK